MLVYKLIINYPNLNIINNKNIILIYFISLIISIKLNEDKIFNNNDYAVIGGISVKLLLNLEFIFLDLINFNVLINEIECIKY